MWTKRTIAGTYATGNGIYPLNYTNEYDCLLELSNYRYFFNASIPVIMGRRERTIPLIYYYFF
jgi:hypothetical protein